MVAEVGLAHPQGTEVCRVVEVQVHERSLGARGQGVERAFGISDGYGC